MFAMFVIEDGLIRNSVMNSERIRRISELILWLITLANIWLRSGGMTYLLVLKV